MLICPSFFDGRLDGIGRVSGAFFSAMQKMAGKKPYVLSSNDTPTACAPSDGRCFGRRHLSMLVSAFFLKKSAGVSLPLAGNTSHRLPIVCTHLGLSPVARILAARWGEKYTVFIHGVEAWKPLPVRSRWGIKKANKLFFNSEHTRRTFLNYNPWAAEISGVVIPLGMTLNSAGVDFVSPPKSENEFRVLVVGRMTKAEYYEGFRDATDLYKGFKQIILAVGMLAKKIPGARLSLVGDGDARPELEKWVNTRPERALVTFHGRVPDAELHSLYQQAHVFALASEGEGFGLVFVEAMAYGLPSVCVDAGAAPEVVTHGETGLVARPRDVVDLADKLFILATNTAVRMRLGRSARHAYASYFAAKYFEERIVDALRGTN